MVGGMLRHLRSLRTMSRDHGWIHTLLEEAENGGTLNPTPVWQLTGCCTDQHIDLLVLLALRYTCEGRLAAPALQCTGSVWWEFRV